MADGKSKDSFRRGSVKESLETYTGFTEHAFRMVFEYGDKFPMTPTPRLNTILPSGVVENNKELEPKAEKGLMAYGFHQAIAPDEAKELPPSSAPFIWERTDPRYPDSVGTLALVQTWSTSVNDKFKAEFETSTTNPDTSIFSPQAVDEFKETLTRLFGEAALKQESVMFCHRASTNTLPVFVGPRKLLLDHLRANPEIQTRFNILKLLEETKDTKPGFVSGTVDGQGVTGEKEFHMESGVYALYIKKGWHTMACTTPIDQFMDGRELHGGKVKRASRCVIA